jgi:hypothetical protein
VLKVRAVTLLDQRDGAFTSLVLDDGLERSTFFDMKVYENPSVLGRAYLVHRAVEADDASALAMLADPSFQPREQAIVEPGSALDLAAAGGQGEMVSSNTTEINRVSVGTRSATGGLLVLSDAYYPGWKVTVDGRSARLLRVNVAFRGVVVPAGDHTVLFTYEPDSFRLGLIISATSVGLTLVLLTLPQLWPQGWTQPPTSGNGQRP